MNTHEEEDQRQFTEIVGRLGKDLQDRIIFLGPSGDSIELAVEELMHRGVDVERARDLINAVIEAYPIEPRVAPSLMMLEALSADEYLHTGPEHRAEDNGNFRRRFGGVGKRLDRRYK